MVFGGKIYPTPISFLLTSPPTLSYWIPDVSVVAACGSWNPVDSSCWALGSWAYLLVEGIIVEFSDELWGHGILTENFLSPSSCRRLVSNCWTLGCWTVVLSTRPRRSCWQNNFGTSLYVVRLRSLDRKFTKSKNIFNRSVYILSFLAGNVF